MEGRKRTPSPKKHSHSVRFADTHAKPISITGKVGLRRKSSQLNIKVHNTNVNNNKNVTIKVTEETDSEKSSAKSVPGPTINQQSTAGKNVTDAGVKNGVENSTNTTCVVSTGDDQNASVADDIKSSGTKEAKGDDLRQRQINKDTIGINKLDENASSETDQQNGVTAESYDSKREDNTLIYEAGNSSKTTGDKDETEKEKEEPTANNINEKLVKKEVRFEPEMTKVSDSLKVPGAIDKNSKLEQKTAKTKSNELPDELTMDRSLDRTNSTMSEHILSRKNSVSEASDAYLSGRRDSERPSQTESGQSRTSSGRRTSTPGRGGQRFMDYYQEILQKKLKENPIRIPRRKSIEVKPESSSDSDSGSEDRESSVRPPSSRARIHRFRNDEDDHHVFNVKWHRRYMLKRKSIGEETKKAIRRSLVLGRFRRKAKLIIYCFRCVKDHCFRFRERSELAPYMNTLENIDYMNEHVSDLMFDRSLFRAKRQMRIPDEIKRILSMDKVNRSDSEIYTAQIALRNIKSFATLPVRMQRLIAQAGVYETYESRRVITREGHPPTSYYFILSGAVVAMQMDPERPIAKRIDEFVKGDSFEERVMIDESPRTMTILTKETCEFLSISMTDFQEIYMQDGVKTLNDPDMGLFLKRLSCLDGWPIGILKQHPREFRFRHYKNGSTVTDDTKQTEWLIIVKSGSIAVLKKLKRVGPYEWRKQGLKALSIKERRDREAEKHHWRRYVLQEIRCPLKQKGEFEEIEERVDGKPKPFQHPDIKVHFEDSSSGRKYYYPNLWTIKSGAGEEEDTGASSFSNINKQYLYVMSGSSKKTGTSANNKPGTGRETKSAKTKGSNQSPSANVQRPESEKDPRPATASPEVSLRSILNSPASSFRTTSTEFEDRVHQIAAGIDINLDPLTDADLNPQFVKVQTLTKGDVWGLANLILDDEQPSFMVVSNGADCVLLNKDFYLQHCPEKLQRKMEQELCPYPSDDRMQESLQVRVDWHDYRRCELSSTMKTVTGRRNIDNEQTATPRPVCT